MSGQVMEAVPQKGMRSDSLQALFKAHWEAHQRLFDQLAPLQNEIVKAALMMAQSLKDGGRLLFFGNGGSASDSLHLAAELSGRLQQERRALAAMSLSADPAALTAIANDYGYTEVFARQIAAHARAGDCAIAISTSGRSPNVLRALEQARQIGVKTIALLGRDGGLAKSLAEVSVVVPHHDSARIQEAHIFIGHTWCAQIEQALGLVDEK